MTRMKRRDLIRIAGALGVSAVLVGAGCGDAQPDEPTPAPTSAPPAPTATQAAVAAAPTQASPATIAPTQMPATAAAAATAPATVGPTISVGQAYLAVARGGDPATITQRAIAAVGGMERFVRSGANVIIKPNICVAYHTFEYGATTNPEVVAELVRLCLAAGARRVRVMDTPFGGRAEEAYAVSGIAEAVKAAGGEMEIMSPVKYKDTPIPDGVDIKNWAVYQEIIEADLVINVPIAKHHSLARLTLGGKNFLGVARNPNQLHRNLGQRIADLVSLVRPELTVVDAIRTMMRNGPSGGNLDDVQKQDTIIASPDIVAADAYAATLFGLKGEDIGYVKAAAEMGLGRLDLANLKIEEISA